MKNEIKPDMAQEKGNRLIAEFIGMKFKSTQIDSHNFEQYSYSMPDTLSMQVYGYTGAECFLEDQFSKSWDWLMPVIVKISNLNLPDSDGSSETWQPFPRTFGMTNDDNGYFMFRFNRYFLHEAPALIDAAYAAVVDFIKWYNAQLKGDSNRG